MKEEGPDDELGTLLVEAGELALAEVPGAEVAAAGSHGAPSGPLDEPPQIRAGLLRHDLGEDPPEAADLDGQRVAAAHEARPEQMAVPCRKARLPSVQSLRPAPAGTFVS